MNKHRGEAKNWYATPFEERARMMRDHGVIGRGYAGQVNQIISGSIGFDDWEWGVDLFADDPVVFKKLVYEMRFDEASSWYGEFGPFYVGPAVLGLRAAPVPRRPGPRAAHLGVRPKRSRCRSAPQADARGARAPRARGSAWRRAPRPASRGWREAAPPIPRRSAGAGRAAAR